MNKSPFADFLCVYFKHKFHSKMVMKEVEAHDPFSSPHQSLTKGSFFGNDSYDSQNPTDKTCFFSILVNNATMEIACHYVKQSIKDLTIFHVLWYTITS